MDTEQLPYAFGGPALSGALKAQPEDFIVDEVLGFEPSGAGEHVFLSVEKRSANTEWVAKSLARFAGVAPVAVGFAGLKDRHAVTRQYFTVQLAGRADPDWSQLADPEFRVLSAVRHQRKLARGALRGNRFKLVLRNIDGDRDRARAALAQIAARGVPNYFGAQRFGRGGGNVERAQAMFGGLRVGRDERSILLSAARSVLFNAVLAQRVTDDCWDRALPGDVFQLDGSGSIFGPEPITPALTTRVADGDIHPSGPLWGTGPLRSTEAVAALERQAVDAWPGLASDLEAAGLKQERRALRVRIIDLNADTDGNDWALSFELPAGAYATVVLRELGRFTEAAR